MSEQLCDNGLLVKLFSGSNRYFRKVAERMNIHTTFVDLSNLDAVKSSIKPNTKVIRLEFSSISL